MAEKKKKSTTSKKTTSSTKKTSSKKSTKKSGKSAKVVEPKKEEQKVIVAEHELVPEQILLNEKEKKELFEKYDIELKNLPKILVTDKAIKDLNPKEGDVIKISRNSYTAGKTVFYRGVVNE